MADQEDISFAARFATTSHDEGNEAESKKTNGCIDKCQAALFGKPVKSAYFSWKTWGEFLYDGKDRMSIPDIVTLIGNYGEDEEWFDIYQICAFDSINDRKAYKNSFFKAILCLFIQLPSMVFMLFDLLRSTEKSWCNLDDAEWDDIFLKCLSFGYCLYVAFYIEDMIGNAAWRGMNCILLATWKNKPKFINGYWLRIGGYYNNITSYVAISGSYIIIFLADNPVDLVLNSVALFFIIELDDMLVTKFDYWKIKKFCDEYKVSDDEQQQIEDAPCGECINCFENWFIFGLRFIVYYVLKYIAPLWVGVCS